MGGPSRRSDLRPPPLHHRIRIRIRPPRLCANASPRCPLPNLATPSSLLSRSLYTHTGSGEQQHDLFVVPFAILAGRVQGGGGGGDPRETAGEVGERINRVSGGLAPEFQTFPVNRRRGRGRGGRGVRVAGARDGTKVSVCIKPRERQERLQAVGSPRTSRRGVCYAGCAARGYVPCLTSHDSNSTQTLPAFCICWSAFPRSFARSLVRTFVRSLATRETCAF